jgi:hypothetical protein
LRNLFRKALTKTVWIKQEQGDKLEPLELPPSQKVVYAIVFAIAAIIALTALEVAHMAYMGSWNTEIFAGIMSVVTFIIGIFIGQTA